MGKLGDAAAFYRTEISETDGILQAEKEEGVTNNLIAFTVTVSFAKPFGAPGLGQMTQLRDCFLNPSSYPTNYKPKNDVRTAYLTRWVNSLNTFNSPSDIRRLLLTPYPR